MEEFVSDNFQVPIEVKWELCIVRKLTTDEVERDYEAVMSSKESLRLIFPFDDEWPADDMTIEENRKDLVMHQEEFDRREAFAYTVADIDNTKCIGCLYLYPWEEDTYDAQVYYWIVDDQKAEVEAWFAETLHKWLQNYWGFKKIVYPGRDMPMDEWELMIREKSGLEA